MPSLTALTLQLEPDAQWHPGFPRQALLRDGIALLASPWEVLSKFVLDAERKVFLGPKRLSTLTAYATISLMTVLRLQPGPLHTNSELDVQLFSRCTHSTNIC